MLAAYDPPAVVHALGTVALVLAVLLAAVAVVQVAVSGWELMPRFVLGTSAVLAMCGAVLVGWVSLDWL